MHVLCIVQSLTVSGDDVTMTSAGQSVTSVVRSERVGSDGPPPPAEYHRHHHRDDDERAGVKELNELIVCGVCDGYLIDATTVSHCLHSCTSMAQHSQYIITLTRRCQLLGIREYIKTQVVQVVRNVPRAPYYCYGNSLPYGITQLLPATKQR